MKRELREISEWQKRPSERRRDGIFVVEGIRMCSEIPPERIERVVMTESFLRSHRDLAERFKGSGSPLIITDETEFQRISDTRTPQGVLAAVRMKPRTEEEVLSDPKGVYLFLERIQDPGNLGTMLRSAEAASSAGVLMSPDCCDIYNPKTVRSTMGSIFRVPFAVSADLRGAAEKLRKMGGKVYAAHLGGAVDYTAMDYRSMCAFLIGNEAEGLTEELASVSDQRIRIPMGGQVESLNASLAATVLLYEADRQRRAGSEKVL
ncbi:MAG: RNA methyltransferase [Lachnospiraceae bacterium]|nr:RNA methyltransferase [Lachnospiraceae bacterium]